MECKKSVRCFNQIFPVLLTGVLAFATLAPAGSSVALSQRKSTGRAPAKAKLPPPPKPMSVYDQAYTRGYGDGFTAGEADWRRAVPHDYKNSDSYQRRQDRYDPKYATSEEYRQGFDLGFELGYIDGYYGRNRSESVPANGEILAKAAALADAQRARQQQQWEDNPNQRRNNEPSRRQNDSNRPRTSREPAISLNIPRDTEMQIRLTSPIDTKNNRVGDKFTAEVISPSPYDGATIEGHIATLKKSGKVTGQTELGIAFDTLTLRDGRSASIEAQLDKIIESETVKKVDEEGRVESGSRSRDSQVRGGVGAAAGAVIGGILGGGKGALLGAVLGGAAGVGTVYIEGEKDLLLDPGTDMIIHVLRANPR